MTTTTPVDEARLVAVRAGVEVRPILEAGDCDAASALLAAVWKTPRDQAPIKPDVMRAIAFSASYVHGAYDPGLGLVGVSVAFLGKATPGALLSLHSHITGVMGDQRRRGLGFVLKLHQRGWALERGIETISWTCDPLVRRNMIFNLRRLGATVERYLPDFYGAMTDGVNAGDASDRAYVSWALTDRRAPVGAVDAPSALVEVGGLPVSTDTGSAVTVLVGTPSDIETLRSTDLETARMWRQAQRQAMQSRLSAGWTVSGFTADGDYVLEAP